MSNLSFICTEMEGTDFYQHIKYFCSINAFQLLLIFRINLISFIYFQFESERILLLIIKHNNRLKHGSVLQGWMMEMEVIDKGRIINQAQVLWGPTLPNN